MLTYEEFSLLMRAAVPELRRNWLNTEQERAVSAGASPPTLIVAGPGSGKTTVLSVRLLKLILVDDIPAASIVATTFTRKAAAELRSRILSWGYAALSMALQRAQEARQEDVARRLSEIDINAVRVGTLDALAEEFIQDCRPIGGITPATIESFLSRGLMREHGLFANGRFRNPALAAFLNQITPHFPGAHSFSSKLTVCLSFADRVRHDVVDLPRFGAQGQGQQQLCQTVVDYTGILEQSHLADFARTETHLLEMIQTGVLARVTNNLRALLVDEFQDTNYIQEQIYIELCRRAANASLTIVGDDDQSIFRFRGATVEIFSNFSNRLANALGAPWRPNQFNLHLNYRSTPKIVGFCQHFIEHDLSYQPARSPNKVPLVAAGHNAADPSMDVPILGMFRQDCDVLANDLSQLLLDIFRGTGRRIRCGQQEFTITRDASGDFGDAVLLGGKVRETAGNGRARLPLLLRANLENQGIRVFNPRGRDLGEIPSVQRLLGIVLECIDPNAAVQNAIQSMSPDIRGKLNAWRQAAQAYIRADPRPGGLASFVRDWQTTRTGGPRRDWPRDWPLLELIFTVVTWIPELQSDPEGQVYLEAVTRAANEVGQIGSYRARLVFGLGVHDNNSVKEAIRGVFEGLAAEEVEVDEEIMPYVPRSYFPMMTIHQVKGLEFPMTIVDVGSDYSRDHHAQRRFRFPVQGDNVHMMEDAVAQFCPIGAARSQRTAVDRAWDDLRRLNFVAYSRAQNVLLLVGLTPLIRVANPVKSLALGDTRAGRREINFVEAALYRPDHNNSVALI